MMKNNYNNKSVLVTGATGLIGSYLVRALLSAGARVFAMGRNLEKLKLVFECERDENKLLFVEGNIANEFPKEADKLDYIFHAASPISGVEIKEKPVDTIASNLNGTLHCLEYLKMQGDGRLVVFSSATVYGNQLSEEMTVSECDTVRADALHIANAPYSESKRMIEVLARAYNKQYGVDTVIVRISYAYGFTKPSPNTAFYEFVNKAVAGENIVLNNSGMGRRDNIHVSDVVNGLMLIAEKGETAESYNLSSNGDKGNYRAIDEIAQMIVDEANILRQDKRIETVIKAIECERKPGMRLDNTKAKALGWSVNVELEDGINDTIKKYMG